MPVTIATVLRSPACPSRVYAHRRSLASCVCACVRKTLRRVSSKGPTAPFTSKLRRHEPVNPHLLPIPLDFSLFLSLSLSLFLWFSLSARCVFLYVHGISMISETDLSRLLPILLDALDIPWPPQYRSPRANSQLESFFPFFPHFLFASTSLASVFDTLNSL